VEYYKSISDFWFGSLLYFRAFLFYHFLSRKCSFHPLGEGASLKLTYFIPLAGFFLGQLWFWDKI